MICIIFEKGLGRFWGSFSKDLGKFSGKVLAESGTLLNALGDSQGSFLVFSLLSVAFC